MAERGGFEPPVPRELLPPQNMPRTGAIYAVPNYHQVSREDCRLLFGPILDRYSAHFRPPLQHQRIGNRTDIDIEGSDDGSAHQPVCCFRIIATGLRSNSQRVCHWGGRSPVPSKNSKISNKSRLFAACGVFSRHRVVGGAGPYTCRRLIQRLRFQASTIRRGSAVRYFDSGLRTRVGAN